MDCCTEGLYRQELKLGIKHNIQSTKGTQMKLVQLTEQVDKNAVKEKFPQVKSVKWTPHPKVGWWQDRKSLIMFHGTHYSNLEGILSSGLYAPSSGPTAGWVSLAFDPNTAFGYASMSGGESSFRAAGAKAHTVPPNERLILVLKLDGSWAQQHMDPGLSGNMPEQRKRLENKDLYDNWNGQDSEYYQLSELRFPKMIPANMVLGYMLKR